MTNGRPLNSVGDTETARCSVWLLDVNSSTVEMQIIAKQLHSPTYDGIIDVIESVAVGIGNEAEQQ
jgi:hypothetical protein